MNVVHAVITPHGDGGWLMARAAERLASPARRVQAVVGPLGISLLKVRQQVNRVFKQPRIKAITMTGNQYTEVELGKIANGLGPCL